jgi:membrane-bound lytic murein transglycosylase D
MFTRFLICCSLSLSSFFIYAATGIDKELDRFRLTEDTTTQKKDTMAAAAAITDPKDGFKNLFISGSESGVSMEELNPMAISFVEDYIEKNGKMMEDMKISGKPYFDLMDVVLTQHGLPKELKYLAVIESFLKSNARSWTGAVGPWQFMPTTARNMGLKVTKKLDERRDINKSTHAASKYLNTLFDLYGDWLLVIAAYNGGPGTVNSAIRKSGSKDFWQLQRYLPAESRNHVKKFIATHYIMEGVGGITTLTKTEADNFLLAKNTLVRADVPGAKSQNISGRYNASIIVKHLTMDITEFNKLNPDFDRQIASNGNYELHLPGEKMDLFLTKKFDILDECVQYLLNNGAPKI